MDSEPSTPRLAAGCLNTLVLVLSLGLFWSGAGYWIESCDVSECAGHAEDILRRAARDTLVYELENHFEESLFGLLVLCAVLVCAVSNALSIVFNAGSAAVCASCSALRRALSNPYSVGTITFLLLGAVQLYLWSHRKTVVHSPSLDCVITCTEQGRRSQGAMAAAAALSLFAGSVNAVYLMCTCN